MQNMKTWVYIIMNLICLRPGHTGPNARIANKSRLLHEFDAIAGFERFKTLLRVQIDVFLTRINVFLTQLTPFLRDPYVIRAQIARHLQPRTTDPNRVKLTQKPEFVRDQYVIRSLGLCDRAFTKDNTKKSGLIAVLSIMYEKT